MPTLCRPWTWLLSKCRGSPTYETISNFCKTEQKSALYTPSNTFGIGVFALGLLGAIVSKSKIIFSFLALLGGGLLVYGLYGFNKLNKFISYISDFASGRESRPRKTPRNDNHSVSPTELTNEQSLALMDEQLSHARVAGEQNLNRVKSELDRRTGIVRQIREGMTGGAADDSPGNSGKQSVAVIVRSSDRSGTSNPPRKISPVELIDSDGSVIRLGNNGVIDWLLQRGEELTGAITNAINRLPLTKLRSGAASLLAAYYRGGPEETLRRALEMAEEVVNPPNSTVINQPVDQSNVIDAEFTVRSVEPLDSKS
ncbi:MAG: hypothetical protein A3B68_06675 [Candidatus Melainabacteria bacterium RIFCSPHIGHO2_02_FULL_34_12]|nr:MAG: hypothetical protein A3B68_06675 [Candidatus Melainabacteria bacterium RIFCSPHIGHO2_02_FULL_34_12]